MARPPADADARTVAAVADALYRLPPEQFTAARDAAGKAADPRHRPAIRAMRRPTTSAYLVNRLSREQPDLLEQLLGLGPALAAAQAQGSGPDLRALGQQRRQLVQQVAETACHGGQATAAVRTEVEQTLEAALADGAAADAVRSGTLVRPLAFAGFGGVDLDGAVAAPAGPVPRRAATSHPSSRAAPESSVGAPAARGSSPASVPRAERAAQEAAAALDDAVSAARIAQTRTEQTQQVLAAAAQERSAVEREVAELEQHLAGARARLHDAGAREHAARGDVDRAVQAADRARVRVARAQEQAERARAELDRLRRS